MSDENTVEKDWEYMERTTPWLYEAFHRVPRLREAMDALFDTPVTRWKGDDEVDLTDKALIGLLQVEIEELKEELEGLSRRRGWRILCRARDDVLYQDSGGRIAKLPLVLADVLTRGAPFEGDIEANGTDLVFSVGDEMVARVPRSLVLELRGSPSDSPEGEGGTGGRPARPGQLR